MSIIKEIYQPGDKVIVVGGKETLHVGVNQTDGSWLYLYRPSGGLTAVKVDQVLPL